MMTINSHAYRWTHRLPGCPFLELLSSERCPAALSSAQESVRDTGESWWLKERESRGEVTLFYGVSTWTTAQHWPHFLSLYSLQHGCLAAALSFFQWGQEDWWKWENYKIALEVTQSKAPVCVWYVIKTNGCEQKMCFLLPWEEKKIKPNRNRQKQTKPSGSEYDRCLNASLLYVVWLHWW